MLKTPVIGRKQDTLQQNPGPTNPVKGQPSGFIERRADLLLLLLLLYSMISGLIAVLEFRTSPFFFLPVLDEYAYVQWAMDIVSDGPLSRLTFYQDPAYPYFLALVFKVLGTPATGTPHPSWFAVRVIQVLMGTAGVGLVFFTTARLAGRGQALLAALIFSFCHGLYFYQVLLLKGTMVIFFSALLCYLGVAVAQRPEAQRRWFFLGLALGLLSLLRGNFLLLIPVLLWWTLWIKPAKPISAGLRRALSIAVGLGVMLLPAVVHNYRASGELILTTSQAGANFYIGNNNEADGTYVILPFIRGTPSYEAEDFKKEAERRAGRPLSPAQISRFWLSEGLAWIRENPRAAAWLWLRKTFYLLNNYDIPDNHNFYVLRRLFLGSLWVSFIGFGMLWGPALLGLAALRRRPAGTFFFLVVAVYSASLVASYILSRYRLALLPALAILAAIGIFWLIGQVRRKKRLTAVLSVIFLAFFFLAGFLPLEDKWEASEYNMLGVAYFEAGELVRAFDCFEQALTLGPTHPDIRWNRKQAIEHLPASELFLIGFGDQAGRRGQLRLAADVYERAVELFPDSWKAREKLESFTPARDFNQTVMKKNRP